MPIPGRRVFRALTLLLLLAAHAHSVDPKKKKANNGPVFGGRLPIPGSLRGVLYRLFRSTAVLPDFSRLRPVATYYTTSLNYPEQPFDDEWFAIVYDGAFQVAKPGRYRFELTCDDGAQLYIDGKRIIDLDGIHETESDYADVNLEAGVHRIRVPYFQGPRPYVALILEVQPPGGKKRVFNTDDFRLTAPPPPDEPPPVLKRK